MLQFLVQLGDFLQTLTETTTKGFQQSVLQQPDLAPAQHMRNALSTSAEAAKLSMELSAEAKMAKALGKFVGSQHQELAPKAVRRFGLPPGTTLDDMRKTLGTAKKKNKKKKAPPPSAACPEAFATPPTAATLTAAPAATANAMAAAKPTFATEEAERNSRFYRNDLRGGRRRKHKSYTFKEQADNVLAGHYNTPQGSNDSSPCRDDLVRSLQESYHPEASTGKTSAQVQADRQLLALASAKKSTLIDLQDDTSSGEDDCVVVLADTTGEDVGSSSFAAKKETTPRTKRQNNVKAALLSEANSDNEDAFEAFIQSNHPDHELIVQMARTSVHTQLSTPDIAKRIVKRVKRKREDRNNNKQG